MAKADALFSADFPTGKPPFPVTPIINLKLNNIDVFVKDESVNEFSGTHKDRIGWEVIVLYKAYERQLTFASSEKVLPKLSIISSGSAAIAIGRMLKDFDLPKLKVLADYGISQNKVLVRALEESHCELFFTHLQKGPLSSNDILNLTNNQNGIDLTAFLGIMRGLNSYDQLCQEIINFHPDFVFLPFGTGALFSELIFSFKSLLSYHSATDKRFQGNKTQLNSLRSCSILGGTSYNSATIADKLYAPYRPFGILDNNFINYLIRFGFCGNKTGIYKLEEKYIKIAFDLANSSGINCEPSGIAGLALLLQMNNNFLIKGRVLIINTGKLKL